MIVVAISLTGICVVTKATRKSFFIKIISDLFPLPRRSSIYSVCPGKENSSGQSEEIAGGAGLVAINAMVATQNYADAVRTAVEAGVDAIVSGAGLPLELPGLVEKADVALAPIVSSGRAAKLILRRWAKASTAPPTS